LAKKREIRMVGGLNVHRLVAEVAGEMANELFEAYARENAIYKRLRANGEISEKQARLFFVNRVMPKLYEDARQQLASCLAQPDEQVSEHMKAEIHEALCLDNALRANRMVARDMVTAPTAH
jgi:hypothetical protein